MLHEACRLIFLSNIENSGTYHGNILKIYTADLTIELKAKILPTSLPKFITFMSKKCCYSGHSEQQCFSPFKSIGTKF